eukprot:TRINITY_DN221_c0_g1_i3.p1 TRINITY_DN221_c0_g1~~TRINITY_DN221_c0_g1_i3.p1  ORF type:complete len:970 (-),score=127.20 TRINITY_DN221_c0_g1_i3:171-3080(-)
MSTSSLQNLRSDSTSTFELHKNGRDRTNTSRASTKIDVRSPDFVIRLLLISILFVDLILTIALVSLGDIVQQDTSFEQAEDVGSAWIQMLSNLGITLLGVVSLGLFIPYSRRRQIVPILQTVAVLRVISIILSFPSLSYPTSSRLSIALTCVILNFVELIVISVLLLRASRLSRLASPKKVARHSVYTQISQNSSDHASDLSKVFVEELDNWMLLRQTRKFLRKKYRSGRNAWALLAFMILGIGIATFVAEFKKVVTTQSPLYVAGALESMNDPSLLNYFDYGNETSPKVLLVVIDGLRYDFTSKSAELNSFLSSEVMLNDSVVLHMRAQLPSMSVPNWISILTGAPPESTGVLGNLLVPETQFDSIFKQAGLVDLNRGLTGSPWFSAIIKSTLPFLGGDATLPTSLGGAGDDSSNNADNVRCNITLDALGPRFAYNPYKLFLAHFSDVDIQGHCCGVDTKWNKKDTYSGAVYNKTLILEKIMSTVDSETVVVIVSDHGHVNRGGHGGVDDILRSVPVIFYKKDSNLANNYYQGPGFYGTEIDDMVVQNLDVAPTVCALLGIPVPRQSEGRFIDPVLRFIPSDLLNNHFKDLYYQKYRLVSNFLDTLKSSTKMPDNLPAPSLNESYPIEDYIGFVNQLLDLHTSVRDKTISSNTARNITTSIVLAIALVVASLFLMNGVTFCDVASILPHKEMLDCPSESHLAFSNRKAFIISFVSVALYYLICIGVYNIAFQAVGYRTWDSTVIHTPQVLSRYVAITVVPGIIFTYIMFRATHMIYTFWPKGDIWTKSKILFVGKDATFSNVGMIYLIRYYLLFWTVVSWLFLFILQGSYTFMVPGIFRVHFVYAAQWAMRFRVLTVQFMSLPLCFSTLIVMIFGPWGKMKTKLPDMDGLYLIKMYKDLRAISVEKKRFNFEESLEEHKNKVYYSALIGEVKNHKFRRVQFSADLIDLGKKRNYESVPETSISVALPT